MPKVSWRVCALGGPSGLIAAADLLEDSEFTPEGMRRPGVYFLSLSYLRLFLRIATL